MEIFMSILVMLGGVGVFMHGMKQMSSGIEQSAGAGVRNLFKAISKNRMTDYAVGIGTTAIVQSSSATSILTVGLANAGIVNLKQGSGIVLGAKVGTTLTAFIIALSGVSTGGFSIGAVFSATAFVGVIMTMTASSDSLKKLALFLTGFGLLFLGLEVMEFAIGGKDSLLSMELTKVFNYEIMQNPILLLLLGILFTCIIQSSSAATGIFIMFLTTGVITSIDQAFFLMMGANIGTCSDGIMAAIGSNVNGKRIALFHLLTSTMGALAFTIILLMFREPITGVFEAFISKREWSLAIFNLAYNLIYTLILLAFLNPLLALVTKLLKDKPADNPSLNHIDERMLATPALAISQTLKEVYDMAVLAKSNLDHAFEALITEDMSQSKKIADTEYRIDFLTSALANYIIKVSSLPISYTDEKLMGGLHHVITDIERIGDHAVNLAKETNFMKQQDLHFLAQTTSELKQLYDKLTHMYDLCLGAFASRKVDTLKQIADLHREILDMTSDVKNLHTLRLNSGEYSVELSKCLYSVLLTVQRVADHAVNVAFSIRSSIGSKTETFRQLEQSKKK